MKILDFGRNAYQFSLFFKFPCVSDQRVKEILLRLAGESKAFQSVSKGEPPNLLTLSAGEGNESAPLFQLKVGTDSLTLFAGWFVSYEKWMKWRDSLVPVLAHVLVGIPNELVLSVFTQCSSPIPADRAKRPAEIPELKYSLELFQRFLPSENRERGNSYAAFSDAQGKRTVEWWLGGFVGVVPIPGYENVLLNTRLNILGGSADLRSVLESHVLWSDNVLEKFHSNFLSLFIKT